MKKKILLVFLAIMLVVSLAAFGACGEEEVAPTTPTIGTEVFEFNFAGAIPAGGDYGAFWQAWADDIERLTNGRVKITIYFGGTLGPATDQLEMLKTGIAHIVYHVPPWTAGVFPLSEGASLPFVTPTPTAVFQYGRYILQWDKCTEYDDYKVLALGASPSGRIWFTDKKVTTLEDMKGLKIRSGGGVIGRIPPSLGASTVGVAAIDIYMALERGTVEGILIDPGYLQMIKGWEVLKYGISNPLYLGTHQILMSKEAWDSLPCDLQLIVGEYCQGTWSKWLVYAIEWETRALNALIEGGTEIYSLSEAEMARWKNLLEPIVDDWITEQEAKGVPAREAVEIARTLTTYEK